MPRARNLVLSIALIAAVFTGYLLMKRNDSTVDVENNDISSQEATETIVAKPTNPRETITSIEHNINPASGTQVDASNCLSQEQLESDPVLAAEIARFDALATSGPTIESYRGLSSAELAGLANQGDSAAMAARGAISVMRAMNLDENRAIDYLVLEETSLRTFSFQRPLKMETMAHLEEARDWFYRAAVHGRLLALQSAGEILGVVGGSPTELGWIPQDEYETLEGYERHALDPANVYGALAFEIAPELRSGPLGTMLADLTPGGDRQQLLLHELAWQFNQDREAASLPPFEIPASTAPSMEELESMLCKP